jgi:hypothetical protein
VNCGFESNLNRILQRRNTIAYRHFAKKNAGSFKTSIGLLYLKLGLANNPRQKHVFIKPGVRKILGIL